MPVPRAWGWLALACYLVHALELVVRFPVANLLWSCDVAAVLVSIGLLTARPLPVAVGCFMFIPGNLVWSLDLAWGGELLPTAPLTHGVVFSLSILGARRLGVPRGTWWVATLAMAACTAAARVVGPESENVNLAFRIPPGWEEPWPSHGAYVATWTVLIAATFAALQAALRRFGAAPVTVSRPERGPAPATPR